MVIAQKNIVILCDIHIIARTVKKKTTSTMAKNSLRVILSEFRVERTDISDRKRSVTEFYLVLSKNLFSSQPHDSGRLRGKHTLNSKRH